MLPANQSLSRPDARVVEFDDRLIVNQQFAPVDGFAQLVLELETGEPVGLHGGVEHRVASPAAGLGVVHRAVGVPQHVVGAAMIGAGP